MKKEFTESDKQIMLRLVENDSVDLSWLAADFSYGAVLSVLNKLGGRESGGSFKKLPELSVTVAVGRHACKVLLK